MSRLGVFSLEENEDTNDNDLLIDKLLDKKKEEEKSPTSLTADLLKQRDTVTKEVEKVTEEQDEGDESESEDSGDDSTSEETGDSSEEGSEGGSEDTESDGNEEGDKGNESEGNEEGDKEDKGEDGEKEENPKEEDGEEDEGAVADSEEDLEGSIGSGLAEESYSPPKKREVKPPRPVTKSKPRISTVFDPLRKAHQRYLVALEELTKDNSVKPTSVTEQPVTYVKEEILESVDNLTKVAYSYIESNQGFMAKVSESLKKVNERAIVFSKLIEAGKYRFTHKLLNDRDILGNISYSEESDIRDTGKAALNYLESSSKVSSLIMNNDFSQLSSAFTSMGFDEVEGDLVYSKPIPGFNVVTVSLVPYTNYIKTKVDEFHYYKSKVMRTEDLYNLPSISMTKDNDVKFVAELLNELVSSTGISVDTLGGISSNFTKFIDELKVLAYNVQSDEYKNLADLGLDSKIQDFIKFKLVMEIAYININLALDYITSVMSALNVLVELTD